MTDLPCTAPESARRRNARLTIAGSVRELTGAYNFTPQNKPSATSIIGKSKSINPFDRFNELKKMG